MQVQVIHPIANVANLTNGYSSSQNHSILCILCTPLRQEVTSEGPVDAFVVVYAVNDRDSFDDAVMSLHVLRKKELLDSRATILVANKGDMVRGRDIEQEGIQLLGLFA